MPEGIVAGAFLSTKMSLPPPGRALVPRPQLYARLTEGLAPGSRLTMISAPAGYGKTTLLGAWAAACGCPVAWLALDEGDNDPARFLAYLVLSVQKVTPDVGQELLAYLGAPNPPSIDEILPVWVNALESHSRTFVLILDDYHAITAPEIHRAIAFLVERQPACMRLVIATRKDPPLPIPRLRARGQLNELRQSDLCFSAAETAVFMQQGIGAQVSADDTALLLSRTEGWAAGLQMAAISMRDKDDISRRVAAFGASHEYIVDYFAAEVLAQQAEPVKMFLLQTSILDQLCGPLCDALTGDGGAQQTLEGLHLANLFVAPLDSERNWYRYHPLFRDLLRKQLQQELPERLPELHGRAGAWYEAQDMPDQAIEHARLAGNAQAVNRLVEKNAEAVFVRGEHVTLQRWLSAIPADELRRHPQLQFFQAIMLSAAGKFPEAERAMQEVDRMFAHLDPQDPAQRAMLGRAATAHALAASLQDDPQAILSHADRALALLPADEMGWRSSVLLAKSYASYLLGDPAGAVRGLSASIEMAKATNTPFLVLVEVPMLAEACWVMGQLKQAEEICRAGFEYMDQKGLRQAPMCDHLFITRGGFACERNELDQAAEWIRCGLELSRTGRVVPNQILACQAMLRVCLARGDLSGAQQFLAAAEALLQKNQVPIKYRGEIIDMRVRVLIDRGRGEQAMAVLVAQGIRPDAEIRMVNHTLFLHLARLTIVQGDLPAADTLLDRLAERYRSNHCLRWLLSVQLLRSRLQLARGEFSPALRSLQEAFELAEPEGFIRDFVDEGEALIPLLQEAVRRKIRPGFAQGLMRLIQGRAGAVAQPEAHGLELVEPLSPREREVLVLVADGLSNQQIAARLVLSLRTIKFHTTNIYGKLGVKSRTEAVSVARRRGLF
jgi:LuxR family transcriptional regulator, maltose regulon positive regulatory protein